MGFFYFWVSCLFKSQIFPLVVGGDQNRAIRRGHWIYIHQMNTNATPNVMLILLCMLDVEIGTA